MEKILRSKTIIPQALYIHRDADRQLKEVINDMGRPGYVLVARQMGKTNLLINAKRELESEDDAFVYLDLSKSFDSVRECLRNIIDTVIETHTEKFSGVSSEINRSRTSIEHAAHKEHEHELKVLLHHVPGKLVIILDEIDALKNTSFSDQVFSLIRSIYFSRINYSEYERLTYVLSGVAEPSEIIKDKNISPFNIGQKIYLNDFSEIEFKMFLTLSKLDLDDEVSNKIYEWTRGNPRTTWDICSRIEDHLIDHKDLNCDDVDTIVKQLYLIQYDKAPIDHIRDLVEDSRIIRDAVLQISYGKGNLLSDDVKSKLYLAGIIGADSIDGVVMLKNRLLEEVLNEKWLQDIERKNKDTLKLAKEKFDTGDYHKALDLYHEYLEQLPDSEEFSSFDYYNMAVSYYETGDNESSIQYFDKMQVSKEQLGVIYYDKIYRQGVSYLLLGNFIKGIELFDVYINENPEGSFYYQSLLNKSSAFSTYDYEARKNEVIDINLSIIDAMKDNDLSSKNEILTAAYVGLTRVYGKEKNNQKAYDCAIEALNTAKNIEKPSIYCEVFNYAPDEDSKIASLNSAIDLIIKDDLTPGLYNATKSLHYSDNIFLELLIASFDNSIDAFDKLIEHKSKSKEDLKSDRSNMICGNMAIRKHRRELALSFYERIIERGDLESEYYLPAVQSVAYLDGHKNQERLTQYYALMKSKGNSYLLADIDYDIFIHMAFQALNDKDYEKAEEYIKCIRGKGKSDKVSQSNSLIVIFLEMLVLQATNKDDEAAAIATEIAEIWPENDPVWDSDEDQSELIDNIKRKIFNKPANINMEPIRVNNKYGRNQIIKVKYMDGKVVEAKYKKLINDINNKLCKILE